MFHFLWAILLLILVGAAVFFRRRPSPLRLPRAFSLTNLCLAILVAGFVFVGLQTVFGRLDPFLEVVDVRVPWPADRRLTVGNGTEAQVVLHNPSADRVHLALELRPPDSVRIIPLSVSRRVEVNGTSVAAELEASDCLELRDERLCVLESGGRSITFDGPGGASVARGRLFERLLTLLPVIRDRHKLVLGYLDEAVGLFVRPPETPRAGTRAVLFSKGGRVFVGYPSARDRSSSRLRIVKNDDAPGRGLEQPVATMGVVARSGDALTLGYTRYRLEVDERYLELRPVERIPRIFIPLQSSTLVVGRETTTLGGLDERSIPGPLSVAARIWIRPEPGRAAPISGMSPEYAFSSGGDPLLFGAREIATAGEPEGPSSDMTPETSVPQRRHWSPGEIVRIEDRNHARVDLRYQTEFVPSRGALKASAPFATWWRLAALAGVLYLVATLALSGLGLLSPDNFLVYHLSALLLGLGTIMLAQLGLYSDPIRYGGYGPHQLIILNVASSLVLLGLAWSEIGRRRLVRRRLLSRPPVDDATSYTHPFDRLDKPIWPACPYRGGLVGFLARQPRVWILYGLALALLTVQLPFGETGITVPGLGSVQPIEAVKTLLLVYFAYWTARAVEVKTARLMGPERLKDRVAYLLHAFPVLLILGLSYGLDDFSPILIFAVFIYLMYRLSLVRPARGTEPGVRFYDSFVLEQVVLLVVLPVAVYFWVLPQRPTVYGRFLVWINPWKYTGRANQVVGSLWSMIDVGGRDGLLGAGLGNPNMALPPAVQDDFILALLGNTLGLAGVALLMITYLLFVLGGLRAMRAISLEVRSDLRDAEQVERVRLLSAGGLLMWIVQLAVVFGSVTGALPVVGQPLPFLSAGGSYLAFFCLPVVAFLVLGARWVVSGAGERRRPWV